jgi:hypothetical protein
MALSVFEKQDPEDLSLEEIDQAIEKYPYFAVLHFIKAAKLSAAKTPDAQAATAKTALYFPNPHWLQYQLDGKMEHTEHDESLAEIMTTHNDPEIYEELEEDVRVPEAGILQEDLEEEYDDKRIYDREALMEADAVVPAVEVNIEEDIIIDEVVPAVEDVEEEEPLVDEIVPAVEANWEDETVPDEIVPAIEANWEDEAAPDEILPTVEANRADEPIAVLEEENSPGATLHADETEAEEGNQHMEIPGFKSPAMNEAPGDTESLIPIEPLYTIDYFASQGIKLPLDEIPSDQLGKKLKSFTEWLKSMKKIQPDKVDRQMDSDTENHIRKEAEHSNDSQEVYTEALAEVYLKQGLEDKAVDVFKKLSLLDPSKSAYFAARIREIKEI